MNVIYSFDFIDCHLETAPFRIITSGVPYLKGETMEKKMTYMKENYDWIRKRTIREAGGQRALCAAFLMEPINEDADFGVFYADNLYYMPMCGGGSLALAAALVEMGLVTRTEPETKITFETPAGLINTFVKVENGKAVSVTLENVTSFLYEKDVKVNTKDYGEINVDIAFGGNFFVMVDLDPLGIEICGDNKQLLGDLAMEVIQNVNEVIEVQHPVNKSIDFLDQCMFCQKPKEKGGPYFGQCVYGNMNFDDCPCGTGTSAKMARMYARDELGLNEEFVHGNNINPTQKFFKGVLIGEEMVGDILGVRPMITSQNTAVTGFGKLVFTENDNYKDGFMGV